jgi:hypothetical protein
VASHIDRRQRTNYNILMQIHLDKDLRTGFRVGSFILLSIILLSIFVSCQQTNRPLSSQPTAMVSQPSTSPESSPEPEQSVTELIRELPFLEKEGRSGLLRAWAGVPQHDDYRVARKSEFANSFMIHEYGEIAGAYGLAALVVNKTHNTNRDSLIVFIRRPANRFDVNWIYRNMDLSKYGMSRASGDIFVNFPREDGTSGICEIQWDRKESRWACTAIGRV